MVWALPFLPIAALASPTVAPPEEIVVTGRGLGTALGDEVFDVVTIGRERLATGPGNRLEEVLRDVPGFQLFRRSDARSANPTSQGATLRALGGNASSRALLILDGVPQSDPFGGWVSWPAYDPRRLGQVRMVRGGGSGRNGPGALAGTIELVSAGPQEPGGNDASIAYGSRDSLDAFAAARLPLGPGLLSVSGAYAEGEGFIPVIPRQRGAADRRSPYRQASLSLRALLAVGQGTELQASGLTFTDRRERGTALSGIRTAGADASLRLVGRRWSALAYLQTRDFYNSFASVAAGRATVTRASEQYSVPSTGLGGRFEARPSLGRVEARLGADGRRTEGRTNERNQFVAGEATRGRSAGGTTTTLGAFAELGWSSESVTVTAGARLDRWLIRNGFLSETFLGTGQAISDLEYRDRSGWRPTARAGAAWRPAAGVRFRAAAYLGWRLPTLNELYRPFRVGADATAANVELDPERLRGLEAGADFQRGAGRVSVTAFDNRLERAIANVTLGRGPGLFPGVGFVGPNGQYNQRQNLDAVVSRGIEIDAGMERGSWTLSAGYSFADARVEARGAASALDRLRPAQTPRHSFSATAGWNNGDGARGSLTVRYAGRQFEDDLNVQRMPDALTLDAAASLPVYKNLFIELRAENISNENVVAAVSGAGIVERATPRTVWIGLRISPF